MNPQINNNVNVNQNKRTKSSIPVKIRYNGKASKPFIPIHVINKGKPVNFDVIYNGKIYKQGKYEDDYDEDKNIEL